VEKRKVLGAKARTPCSKHRKKKKGHADRKPSFEQKKTSLAIDRRTKRRKIPLL